jgi:hypothetical protein
MAGKGPESPWAHVSAVATDALYVAVGFGVLAFHRAQVRRRELETRLRAVSRYFVK